MPAALSRRVERRAIRRARLLVTDEIRRSVVDDLRGGVAYREGLFAATHLLTRHLETI